MAATEGKQPLGTRLGCCQAREKIAHLLTTFVRLECRHRGADLRHLRESRHLAVTDQSAGDPDGAACEPAMPLVQGRRGGERLVGGKEVDRVRQETDLVFLSRIK